MRLKFRTATFGLWLLLIGVVTAVPQTTKNARTPTLQSSTTTSTACHADTVIEGQTLKTANISVLERRTGRMIPGLKADDFIIRENGDEREIGRVSYGRGPLSVAILVDTSPSRSHRLSEVAAAADIIIQGLRVPDGLSIFTFDGVVNQIVRNKRVGDISGREIKFVRSSHGTRLYDAVDAAIRGGFGDAPGRKVIILFTDGDDNSSQLAGADTTLRELHESEIAVYAVQYPARNILTPNRYMQSIAEETGGRFFMSLGLKDSADEIASILDDVAARYTLCYWSTEPKPTAVSVKLKSTTARPYAIKMLSR